MLNLSESQQRITRTEAKRIYEQFIKYNENFRRITQRAKQRFENRDWSGSRDDLKDRIDLYEKSVLRTVNGLKSRSNIASTDGLQAWESVKTQYWSRVDDIPDGGFAKTFFNSVYRNILHENGLDPTHVSDTSGIVSHVAPVKYPAKLKSYLNWEGMRATITHLLNGFAFKAPYIDVEGDISFICSKISDVIPESLTDDDAFRRIEIMSDVFYQSSRAFLVGKIYSETLAHPFVIALENTDIGVRTEAVLSTVDEISVLFGFTRSYFMVDVEPVEGAIHFISSLIPHKPIDELHTILGRARQGKTERARSLYGHLESIPEEDRFTHADGERGLVMLVFTMPSYDLVFKVLRDNFGHPKTINHLEVKNKYQFVYKHDRAGRLIDSQEFRNIEFQRKHFDNNILEELLTNCSKTVRISGENLIIDHLYSERRLTPLNLFIRKESPELVENAILDYGQAIKDLALTNIFPGDLLLKNFGVSRHGRVIFYDYDELCLLTACNFKHLPEATNSEDELRSTPWFHVNSNDIFPQEFTKFLSLNKRLKSVLTTAHGDIFTTEYWNHVKSLHLNNLAPEISPYYRLASRR